MKVRATAQGFYGGRHIDPGTIFDVDPKMYAGKDDADPRRAAFGWMEKVTEDKHTDAREDGRSLK